MNHPQLRQALEDYDDLIQDLLDNKNCQKEAFLATDNEIWNSSFSLKECPTPQDLKRWMSWKLTRGKNRPRLLSLAESNSQESIQKVWKEFSQLLTSKPDQYHRLAIETLCQWKGIGPATASLIASIFDSSFPFMSDEAAEFLLNRKLKYTMKEYMEYLEKIEMNVENEWTPKQLERAIWCLVKQSNKRQRPKRPIAPQFYRLNRLNSKDSMKRLLFPVAIFLSLLLNEKSVSAAPMNIEPLDSFEEIIPFWSVYTDINEKEHEFCFKINKTIAEKSEILKTAMENDQNSNSYKVELEPERFQTAIDYMENPELAKSQWTADKLPDLVYVANYLAIRPMLKDSMVQLCKQLPEYDAVTAELILQKMPEKILANALLHCYNHYDGFSKKFKEKNGNKRLRFFGYCRVDLNLWNVPIADLKLLVNPNSKCLNHIKSNNLEWVMDSELAIKYDNFDAFHSVSKNLKLLSLNVKLDVSLPSNVDMNLLAQSLNNVQSLVDIKIQCEDDDEVKTILDLSQLQNVSKLQTVIIYTCQLHEFSKFLQKDYPELRNLKLINNQITEIGRLSTPKLEGLVVNHNPLGNINELLSSNLRQLKFVDLSDNQLQIIRQIQFMPELNHLSLSKNRIESISGLLMSHLGELEYLYLDKNLIQSIQKIEWMPKLKTLNLNSNQIRDISELQNSKLTALDRVNVLDNHIQNIDRISPEFMKKLDGIEIN